MATGTLYYSTSLRNKFLGKAPSSNTMVYESGATLAYAKGSPDTITDSGNGFITAGFAPGMFAFTYNATSSGNNITAVLITNVTAGTLTLATTNQLYSSQAFPATGIVLGVRPNNLYGALLGGVIDCYTVGAGIPANADAVGSSGAQLVCRITQNSGAWNAGAFANGLVLAVASGGILAMPVTSVGAITAVWSGVGLINPGGTLAYFRWRGNVTDADADDSINNQYDRIQGTIGIGTGYNLNVSSTTLVYGATLTINNASFTPATSI